VDGLNYHGYNEADGHESCCKWSRANGWGMLGHAEAVASMQAWPEGYPDATANAEVIKIFQQHAAAAKASQVRVRVCASECASECACMCNSVPVPSWAWLVSLYSFDAFRPLLGGMLT
jgi:hypothetical protein